MSPLVWLEVTHAIHTFAAAIVILAIALLVIALVYKGRPGKINSTCKLINYTRYGSSLYKEDPN